MNDFQRQLETQRFANDYQLVDGVAMNAENPNNFLIPHPVLKKHVGVGHFVELRIDSPRFSVHEDAPEKCVCPSCNGEATKPILRHEHPATLLPLPEQNVPSRGWGEDFWVQVAEREGTFLNRDSPDVLSLEPIPARNARHPNNAPPPPRLARNEFSSFSPS